MKTHHPFGLSGLVATLVLACIWLGARAQVIEPGSQDLALVMRRMARTNSIPLDSLPNMARQDSFQNMLVPLVSRIVESGRTNGFLEFVSDLNLRPKVFQAAGSSNNATFGLEYSYRKSIANKSLNERSSNPVVLSLAVEAKGDIALEASKNPNDFLESKVGLHLFQSLGGITPEPDESPEAANQLGERRILDLRGEVSGNAEAKARIDQELQDHLRPQFFYDVESNLAYETDQKFENSQWAYGVKGALVFRDWRRRSDVGWFNLLDYPFAALRSVANQEPFQPSGRSFPVVSLGLDQVDPSQNDARLAVDPDTETYTRVRLDVSFTTPMLRVRSQRLYFTASYRHFQELEASAAIRAASFDRSSQFTMRIDFPYRFNLSYSTGRLPLDNRNDEVYAVGWRVGF